MSNAWNVTEAEYLKALYLRREKNLSAADGDDLYQLIRFYRGEVFYADSARRGARLVRKEMAEGV